MRKGHLLRESLESSSIGEIDLLRAPPLEILESRQGGKRKIPSPPLTSPNFHRKCRPFLSFLPVFFWEGEGAQFPVFFSSRDIFTPLSTWNLFFSFLSGTGRVGGGGEVNILCECSRQDVKKVKRHIKLTFLPVIFSSFYFKIRENDKCRPITMYFLLTISGKSECAVASISSIPLSFFFDLTDGYSGVHKEIPSSLPTPV